MSFGFYAPIWRVLIQKNTLQLCKRTFQIAFNFKQNEIQTKKPPQIPGGLTITNTMSYKVSIKTFRNKVLN